MTQFTRRRYTAPGKVEGTDSDFVCHHCGAYVLANPVISGVNNRNHCPYCLSSRHLDLFEGGDRLSACRGSMRPIGLTLKQSNKRYDGQRELMLVHECQACATVSINRIARDDDVVALRAVLEQSASLSPAIQAHLKAQGIHLLESTQTELPLLTVPEGLTTLYPEA